MTEKAAVVAYVDNGIHCGCNRSVVQRDKDVVVKYLNEHGLQTHEETDASEHAVVLGYVIDGVKLEVLPRPERIT